MRESLLLSRCFCCGGEDVQDFADDRRAALNKNTAFFLFNRAITDTQGVEGNPFMAFANGDVAMGLVREIPGELTRMFF